MELEEIRQQRLKKLAGLTEQGREPFGGKFLKDRSILDTLDNFKEGEAVSLAGRVMANRLHGKAAFLVQIVVILADEHWQMRLTRNRKRFVVRTFIPAVGSLSPLLSTLFPFTSILLHSGSLVNTGSHATQDEKTARNSPLFVKNTITATRPVDDHS